MRYRSYDTRCTPTLLIKGVKCLRLPRGGPSFAIVQATRSGVLIQWAVWAEQTQSHSF